MTKTLEPRSCSSPARRPNLAPVPVLIRIPTLPGHASGGAPRPAGRRRLRREFRVAGCWLLALAPPALACATWGGHRPALLLALNPPGRVAAGVPGGPAASPAVSTISLSLEPAVVGAPAPVGGSSVVLTGQLLPVDPAEEPAHGGY